MPLLRLDHLDRHLELGELWPHRLGIADHDPDEAAGVERLAQSRRSGFWAGQAEPPWQWRDRQLTGKAPPRP